MAVFFIGGAPRTGTSLLNAILCSDPAVHPIMPEAKYLRHLMRAYRYGRDAFEAETKEYFAHREGLRMFTASQIEALCDALSLRFPETRHQIFRNPEMTPALPDLLNVMNDARALITIRDPRDTIASLMTVHDRQVEAGQTNWLTQAGRSADYLARAYNGFYAPVSNLPDKTLYKRILTVRYESLVTQPSETLAQIADFTGLDVSAFEDKPVWRDELLADAAESVTIWWGSLWGEPVSKDRVGAFHEVLTPAEITVIEEVCSAFMAGFGYPPV